MVLFLALLFFGTGSGSAAGAGQRAGDASAVDAHRSAVGHVATAIDLDIDGRPLGAPRADAPCESDTTDEGDADADGVINAFDVNGIQPSRLRHAEGHTPVSSRSRSCCSPRAPPASALLAPRQ